MKTSRLRPQESRRWRSTRNSTQAEETMKPQLRAAAGCLLACLALAASAQQPSPLDVVPDKMPNDIPYGTPISLERADTALAAAVAESKKRGWKLICAVVDSGA